MSDISKIVGSLFENKLQINEAKVWGFDFGKAITQLRDTVGAKTDSRSSWVQTVTGSGERANLNQQFTLRGGSTPVVIGYYAGSKRGPERSFFLVGVGKNDKVFEGGNANSPESKFKSDTQKALDDALTYINNLNLNESIEYTPTGLDTTLAEATSAVRLRPESSVEDIMNTVSTSRDEFELALDVLKSKVKKEMPRNDATHWIKVIDTSKRNGDLRQLVDLVDMINQANSRDSLKRSRQ